MTSLNVPHFKLMGAEYHLMRRRRVLRRLVFPGLIVISGCISQDPATDGQTTTVNTAYTIADVNIQPKSTVAAGVQFNVKITDGTIAPEAPGRLQFSLANTGENKLTITSGPIPPFGVLHAVAETGDADIILWHKDYRASSHVQIEDSDIRVAEIAFETPLESGERITQEYEIRHSPSQLTAGAYEVVPMAMPGFSFAGKDYEVTLQLDQ